MDLSPPARAAMIVCEILNVPVEMIDINLLDKNHLEPEFLQVGYIIIMIEDVYCIYYYFKTVF